MNGFFIMLFKLAKLLYPFVKESILGQDSVLTIIRKRKVFVFVVASNLALFLTTAFLTEQNYLLLDRLKVVKTDIVDLKKVNSELNVKNARLLGLLKGDMDAVCYAHVFGDKQDLMPEEVRSKVNSSYNQSAPTEVSNEEPIDHVSTAVE